VREARGDQEPEQHTPARPNLEALEAMRARLWAAHLKSLDELERRQAEFTGDVMDARAIHEMTLAAIKRQRELEKLMAQRLAPTGTPGANGAHGPEPEPESFFERLSRAEPETQGEAQPNTESESLQITEPISSRHTEPMAETADHAQGPAHSRVTALAPRARAGARETQPAPEPAVAA
jgi:hypothetical protein